MKCDNTFLVNKDYISLKYKRDYHLVTICCPECYNKLKKAMKKYELMRSKK